MSETRSEQTRHLGLFSATSIGVGAIVGGGILALAGTAFVAAGPGAMLAFALNGVISLLTALSFAELSSAFPRSGGTYVFAKRVVSVGAAFSVGWVVWFASILAAALYGLGFVSFLQGALAALWPAAPAWILARPALVGFSMLSVLACTVLLCRTPGSGGNWVNVLKIAVFAVLIFGGAWVWWRQSPPVAERLTPFLPSGLGGLFQAMGYTYIALQGFDLVAAVAGEVREPRRILPRAMLLSLALALAVYLPLLLIIAVAGVPAGGTLAGMTAANPDTVVAVAARNLLGPAGFWLVMVAGVLSMLSALLANLFAASRVAQAMARDRTMPAVLERIDGHRGTPAVALLVTGGLAGTALLVLGDVASAGAAASLIFLVTFALANVICVLARLRRPDHQGFRVPGWPVTPVIGGLACAALAVFQGLAVPAAGAICALWLVVGFFCYLWVFGRRARIVDAASEAGDPDLLELRGRSPLVLVPVANPAHSGTLAQLAACLSPPRVGRVLLLNVIRSGQPDGDRGARTQAMAEVLSRSMTASMDSGVHVECMGTLAPDPWAEIERVAHAHRCAVTLLGMADLRDESTRMRLEALAGRLPGNLVILRSPPDWRPDRVRRVLVPIGGRGVHNALRARLLTALSRRAGGDFKVSYLVVVPEKTGDAERARLVSLWGRLVTDECDTPAAVIVEATGDVSAAVLAHAHDCDLVLLGLSRVDRHRHVFGRLVTQIVELSPTAVMVIGQRE